MSAAATPLPEASPTTNPSADKRHEIIAIAAECSNLAALRAAVHRVADPTQILRKPLLDIASKHPVLANIYTSSVVIS
jgi:hypothetical protein